MSAAWAPILAVLIGAAVRRRHPEPLTWRERVVFAGTLFGVLFTSQSLATLSRAAEMTAAEWWEGTAVLTAVGFTPLALFMAFDVPLRLVRRWEAGRTG